MIITHPHAHLRRISPPPLCPSSRRLIRSGTNNVKRDLTVCTLIKYDRSNTHGLSVYLLEQSNDERRVNHCLHIQSIEKETDRCSNEKNNTLVSSVDFEIFSFSSMAILRGYLSVDISPSKTESKKRERRQGTKQQKRFIFIRSGLKRTISRSRRKREGERERKEKGEEEEEEDGDL